MYAVDDCHGEAFEKGDDAANLNILIKIVLERKARNASIINSSV